MDIECYTSYFYQIRFFEPWMAPLSTAMWDPKWFHNFKGNQYIYLDKNGIINGLRFIYLVPNPKNDGECAGPDMCIKKFGYADPEHCKFLSDYMKKLEEMNPHMILQKANKAIQDAALKLGVKTDHSLVPVFIFYETPNNPCSEREKVLEWFHKNGINISEWKRDSK